MSYEDELFPSVTAAHQRRPRKLLSLSNLDPCFCLLTGGISSSWKKADGMKAEIKGTAEETPVQPIKELAEGSRTEMKKNGDRPTSHACRWASEAVASALAASEPLGSKRLYVLYQQRLNCLCLKVALCSRPSQSSWHLHRPHHHELRHYSQL